MYSWGNKGKVEMALFIDPARNKGVLETLGLKLVVRSEASAQKTLITVCPIKKGRAEAPGIDFEFPKDLLCETDLLAGIISHKYNVHKTIHAHLRLLVSFALMSQQSMELEVSGKEVNVRLGLKECRIKTSGTRTAKFVLAVYDTQASSERETPQGVFEFTLAEKLVTNIPYFRAANNGNCKH